MLFQSFQFGFFRYPIEPITLEIVPRDVLHPALLHFARVAIDNTGSERQGVDGSFELIGTVVNA